MSRPWRDGDIVIDPDGTEWDVWLRHNDGWCMVTRRGMPVADLVKRQGMVGTDLIDNLLARGWRLKEKSDE